ARCRRRRAPVHHSRISIRHPLHNRARVDSGPCCQPPCAQAWILEGTIGEALLTVPPMRWGRKPAQLEAERHPKIAINENGRPLVIVGVERISAPDEQ